MASGNTLYVWQSLDGVPPTTVAAAGITERISATSGERFVMYAFDGGSSDEHLDFHGVMPQSYAGGGTTFKINWIAASATTGDVRFGLAFRAIEDDADDIDTSHTYDYNEANDTCASASGEISIATITFTNGADMDNVGAGDAFVLRMRREASDTGNDTMSGDLQLLSFEMRET